MKDHCAVAPSVLAFTDRHRRNFIVRIEMVKIISLQVMIGL